MREKTEVKFEKDYNELIGELRKIKILVKYNFALKEIIKIGLINQKKDTMYRILDEVFNKLYQVEKIIKKGNEEMLNEIKNPQSLNVHKNKSNNPKK